MSRTWQPGHPLSVRATLSSLRRGGGDPCHRVQPDGVLWRATRTPDGPVLLRLETVAAEGAVRAHAWGPGADWALDGVSAAAGGAGRPVGVPSVARAPPPGGRVARPGPGGG